MKRDKLFELYKAQESTLSRAQFDELIEYKEDRSIDNTVQDSKDTITRIDCMKINSIEIIISF